MHASHIRSRYERYAVHTSRLRGMLIATYVWRIRSMSYVSTAYLPHCFRVYHVCVTYVRRIGPATYVLRIFKCTHKKRSTSAYELRIEEYEPRTVSHGSGCRAGFFQGYAWCSLSLCSCWRAWRYPLTHAPRVFSLVLI